MKLKMYSLYDLKAQVYSPPRYYHNQPQAMRMFQIEHAQAQSVAAQFPHDFQIMELGEFDDAYGSVDMLKKPIAICTLGDIFDLDKKENLNGTDHPRKTQRDEASDS